VDQESVNLLRQTILLGGKFTIAADRTWAPNGSRVSPELKEEDNYVSSLV
jgi:hypothetical protein